MNGDPEDDLILVEDSPTLHGVRRILLNRAPANAFDLAYYRMLADRLEEIGTSGTRVLQIGSAIPKFFSAGRDLREPPTQAAELPARHREVTRLYRTLMDLPCPTIAVVEGHALGAGCVVATLADIRVASPSATFGIPEVRAGSVGGARHLARLLPWGLVRQMALTAQSISAKQAHSHGMVALSMNDTDAWSLADDMAGQIIAFDPQVVTRVKQALNVSENLTLWDGFATELASRE